MAYMLKTNKTVNMGSNETTKHSHTQITLGLIGHSIMKHFPTQLFSNNIAVSHKIFSSTIINFYEKGLHEQLTTLTIKPQAALFIIGGNDIDNVNQTTEHIATISHALMNTARTMHTHNIKPYFLPIQPRRNPTHTTRHYYNKQANIMSYCVAEFVEREFGYDPLIPCTQNPTLSQDGIHLTYTDYSNITHNITTHITNTITAAPRTKKPLQKNHKFLAEEERLSKANLRWAREAELAKQGIYPALKTRRLNSNSTVQGTTKNPYKAQAHSSQHTNQPLTQQTTSNTQNTQSQILPQQTPDTTDQATLSVNTSQIDSNIDEEIKKALLANRTRTGFFKLYKIKHLEKDTEKLTIIEGEKGH